MSQIADRTRALRQAVADGVTQVAHVLWDNAHQAQGPTLERWAMAHAIDLDAYARRYGRRAPWAMRIMPTGGRVSDGHWGPCLLLATMDRRGAIVGVTRLWISGAGAAMPDRQFDGVRLVGPHGAAVRLGPVAPHAVVGICPMQVMRALTQPCPDRAFGVVLPRPHGEDVAALRMPPGVERVSVLEPDAFALARTVRRRESASDIADDLHRVIAGQGVRVVTIGADAELCAVA